MTLCPTALLATAHGRCLRLLAEGAPTHPRGLSSASRALRSQLTPRLQRRLTQLDIAFSVVCHITDRSCNDLAAELAEALGLDSRGHGPLDAAAQTAISAPPSACVSVHCAPFGNGAPARDDDVRFGGAPGVDGLPQDVLLRAAMPSGLVDPRC